MNVVVFIETQNKTRAENSKPLCLLNVLQIEELQTDERWNVIIGKQQMKFSFYSTFHCNPMFETLQHFNHIIFCFQRCQ